MVETLQTVGICVSAGALVVIVYVLLEIHSTLKIMGGIETDFIEVREKDLVNAIVREMEKRKR